MMVAAQVCSVPERWREKALAMDEICTELETACQDTTLENALRAVCNRHAGRVIHDGESVRTLPLSEASLKRHFRKWRAAERNMMVFVPSYKAGKVKVPGQLVAELTKRCTTEGRSSDRCDNMTAAAKSITRDWFNGKSIPGLGTWQDWWTKNYPGLALPQAAPKFPFAIRTMLHWAPKKSIRVYGSKGEAAAKKFMPHVNRTRKDLRPGEVLIFDDVRVDIICVDEETMRPTECKCYIAIDAGTNFIPAFTFRPGNALVSYDVDHLVVRSLQSIGLGKNYQTHLIFERGTLTMSKDAGQLLEKVTEGRIKAHWTSMVGSRRYVGAPVDMASGNWMGKAVIESFMRRFHLSLMELPGQRGNNYSNQPANLGWIGQNTRPTKGLAGEAAKLADIEMAALERGVRVRLDFGLMTSSQLSMAIRQAIHAHNTNRDHNYEGFGKILRREVAPGVYEDLS